MILLIITIPFYSSISIFLLGRYIGQKGSVLISITSIFISMLLSIKLLYGYLAYNNEIILNIYSWINTGLLNINFNLYIDKYSIFMIFLITTISFIVITYSTWYMKEDAHKNRFLGTLLMFAVTMLILVSSSNFLMMFVGWEGVGIMSYLLINFWYFSINSNKSAIKAILYNKIGDIGFLIGISIMILLISDTNILNIKYIPIINLTDNFFTIFLFLFLLASIAKSAQIFLHCWLGDAMAGPTPVSALLHAATMVTAGVFLLFRLESIIYISPIIQNIIILIGLFTIIFGGISSINQYDIKKIIAFSTCSQLGYMFLTNGFLLPELGLFHLLSHGFFKALLFLTAGILIHNFNHEQDLRKFGSFIHFYPLSYILFFIGSLSILSFPFLSGFYSKEAIIESSLSSNFPIFIYIIMVIGAILTSIYSFKLIYYTFYSYPNSLNFSYLYNKSNELKEFPLKILPILIILALGSIFFGYLFKDLFLNSLLFSDIEFIPFYIKLIPIFLSLLGILLSFIIFNPWKYKYLLTILNKRLFIDSLINSFFALPALSFGYNSSFKLLDRGFFEFFGPIGLFRVFYTIPSFYSNTEGIRNINNMENIGRIFIYLFVTFAMLLLSVYY